MVRKRTKTAKEIRENELYILPSPTDEMKSFVTKFKVDMMEHVVSSIKFALENKLPMVEVFQFKNSPFVVTISEVEFDTNLNHIRNYYMENEIYELCPRVENLQEILKRKPNEKSQEDPENPNGPTHNTK